MKKLEHRNVVPIYQVLQGPAADSFIIVMQFCDGGTAKDVSKTNVISLPRAKSIIRDTSIGLCYIHNKGFVHRDIKPDNIFLTAAGDVKIGDFGFVTDELLLGFADGAGTPEYIAPETLSSRRCSFQTDVYALGATFLHMTHGDHWFFRSGKKSILNDVNFDGHLWRQISDDYCFLPHIPVTWRNTIKGLINPDIHRRIVSMDAAANAIARLPLVENWICVVAPDIVTWEQEKGRRRIRVEWRDYLTKSDSWVAWSEGIAGGRKMTLGKSDPATPVPKRYRALQKFFETRTV